MRIIISDYVRNLLLGIFIGTTLVLGVALYLSFLTKTEWTEQCNARVATAAKDSEDRVDSNYRNTLAVLDRKVMNASEMMDILIESKKADQTPPSEPPCDPAREWVGIVSKILAPPQSSLQGVIFESYYLSAHVDNRVLPNPNLSADCKRQWAEFAYALLDAATTGVEYEDLADYTAVDTHFFSDDDSESTCPNGYCDYPDYAEDDAPCDDGANNLETDNPAELLPL